MDIFVQLAEKIIQEQEGIIGPIALEQAMKVNGLEVDKSSHKVALRGNGTQVVEKLVEQYKALFGQASVEACKDAVKNLVSNIPQNQIPSLLR